MTDLDQKSTGQSETESQDNLTHVWLFPVNLDHIKSLCGVLQLVIGTLSLIAFICCTSGRTDDCDDDYSSTYNFFEFISMSTFLTMMLWWLFFVITLNQRLRLVPWRLGELIILGVFGLLFVLADIIIAAQSCGKDSNKAAAAFGFFAFFAMGGHAFLSFRIWRETQSASAAGQADQTTAPNELERY